MPRYTVRIRYPDQAYYPFVGKSWEAVAGVIDTSVGGTGTVYLPLITVGTLQATSMTQDTIIEFPPEVVADNPALAGVSITVPANSLLSDDGTRGGMVGIAAVAPDRLPGPLPPGLELPLVITVQTDGPSNFDRPAPVCFPNLPDPTTGVLSAPGTKGYLMSFNHDKGIWEAVGGMTVSADGKLACTDPGVGILAPGWHGWLGDLYRRLFPPKRPPIELPPVIVTLPPPPFSGFARALLCRGTPEECRAMALKKRLMCEGQYLKNYIDDYWICEDEEEGNFPEHFSPDEGVRSMKHKDCVATWLSVKDSGVSRCLELFQNDLRICRGCIERPDPDSDPLRFAEMYATLSEPTIEEEIANIFDQISVLLRPFVSSPSPFTPELVGQVNALRQLADEVAGGDAREYMRNLVVEREEDLLIEANKIGLEFDDLNLGNAPAYPVLYAATIARPSGKLVLRGETQPYGQYTLFVPADGKLMNVVFYDPITKGVAIITPYLSPLVPYDLPRFNLFPLPADALDSDEDGLPDLVENVYGTDSRNADSDDDGIPDGAEVEQGTDPLSGLAVRTGVIGTLRTPGAAIDIATGNNLAVLAQGVSGVSIVDISNFSQPTILAHLDTPGTAQRVAFAISWPSRTAMRVWQ